MTQLPKTLIVQDKEYTVTVLKIIAKGIIVNLSGTDYTEFIHISKLSDIFISNINEFIKVGDTYVAKGMITNGRSELSLQHLKLRPFKEDTNSRPRVTHSPTYPQKSEPKSIDDMIMSAELSMKDKYGRKLQKTATRRKNSKRRGCNYYE